MKTALCNSAAATVLAFTLAAEAPAKNKNADPASGQATFVAPHWGEINPFYGEINPFWGEINPFYGEIKPFWGEINPFYGEISAFWGEINPFYGEINPFWGEIHSFWRDAGPEWGTLYAQWGEINSFDNATSVQYEQIAASLDRLFGQAENVFGELIDDKKDDAFEKEFLKDLLKDYDIELDDPETLRDMDGEARSRFFLDFYDGLMAVSGTDRVDHWMATANWSPALAQDAGLGDGVAVGLLDFAFSSKVDIDVKHDGGNKKDDDFLHGAAVASLIAAPHDGEGLMGVAPDIELNLFNPFDKDGFADWKDVADGVKYLGQRKVDIINMSLGVPGWTLHQEWANVFSDRKIAKHLDDVLFVVAAGNDGFTQSADVDWTDVGSASNLLVVGSVGPTGDISSFSNRPGEACLLVEGACASGHRLMDRFLVAPGELVLVSDGEDGVTRMSGTSFAAPLVAGAAALVQSRWEWLDAAHTADVLLRSAQDLGAPGVDPVYGHGLLDIGAAMSPLDPDALIYATSDTLDAFAASDGAIVGGERLGDLAMTSGQLRFADPSANQISAFEPLGETYRDFLIPLDDVVIDLAAATANTENYLAERAADVDEPASNKKKKKKKKKFYDTFELVDTLSETGRWSLGLTAARRDPLAPVADGELPFQTGLAVHDRATGFELRMGVGEGALALNRQEGFGLFSDYRPETGGVNPVLGFASGGAYAMSGAAMGAHASLSFGVTSTTDENVYVDPVTGEERAALNGLSDYEAIAFLTDVRRDLGENVSVHASYTHLHEDTGVLGAQGAGALSLDGGARTDAATVGGDARLPGRVSASVSTTFARTTASEFESGTLTLSDDAVSTAFQVTARRDGVMGDHDAVRVSLIQPLHVERGAFEYSAARVVDRETGTLGVVTEEWRLGGERPLVGEVLYASPLFEGRADISLFGRFDVAGEAVAADVASASAGLRFGIDF